MINSITSVRIQIVGWCNRKCFFCPQNNIPAPPVANKKILTCEELSEILFALKGEVRETISIAPYFMSEPLIDKDFPRKIELIRSVFPRSMITINTNGDYLTWDVLQNLRGAGLNFIDFNCYTEQAEIRARRLFGEYSTSVHVLHAPRKSFGINIHSCWKTPPHGGWNNRAGAVGRRRILNVEKACAIPFRSLNILNDGDCILCCNDYGKEAILGNIFRESVSKIYGRGYGMRKMLFGKKRSRGICKYCDYYGGPYLHLLRLE